MHKFILLFCMLHVIFAAPQQFSLKDGEVGASFGGYSANAGLGGLLTGDLTRGFLHAGAATPHGQSAEAGLRGNLNDDVSGVAYANAQHSPSKKTGISLSGSTQNKEYHTVKTEGFVDSEESHNVIQKITPHKKHRLIKPESPHAISDSEGTVGSNQHQQESSPNDGKVSTAISSHASEQPANILIVHKRRERLHRPAERRQQRKQSIRKSYRHKEYLHIQAPKTIIRATETPTAKHPYENQQKGLPTEHGYKKSSGSKTVHTVSENNNESYNHRKNHRVHASGENVHGALNIPIGILQSLQQSLGGLTKKQQSDHIHGYKSDEGKSVHSLPEHSDGMIQESNPSSHSQVPYHPGSGVQQVLQIPVGILQSLQQSLGGLPRKQSVNY